MTLKFNRVVELIVAHVCAKVYQAKCSSSCVIKGELDIGQL